MSIKRRDKRNRILRDRESQMPDGRYRYSYYVNGKQKNIYSWKLERTDKLPDGKRDCVALRDQIAELNRTLDKGLSLDGREMTVYELANKYTATRRDVRITTQQGYKTVLNILEKDEFGAKRIDKVKKSDAKLWLIRLQETDGRSYSSIHSIRGVVRPAFQMAVDDDILLSNPFDFELAKVLVNDSVTREAISRKQERQFLEFVQNDKHFSRYYDAIYVLFKTGMRISEFCGLTIHDIDMKERTININHQLQRSSKMVYYIKEENNAKAKAKTKAGIRVIPMSEDVYEAFSRILENRKAPNPEPFIDGYTGFLFHDKNGMPMVALHWEKYFEHIVEKYNKTYRIQMPKVTPHVCRHTYCSNMAKSGMNPKHLQYLMGHSDISVTLNTYTHVGYEDAKEEVQRVISMENKKRKKA